MEAIMTHSLEASADICTYTACPISYLLSIVGGKWKWVIVSYIAKHEVVRYGELKHNIATIAHKTLSQQLKELEEDGIVHREQYNQIPPKVEYSLTERGRSLVPVLELMEQWGTENQQK